MDRRANTHGNSNRGEDRPIKGNSNGKYAMDFIDWNNEWSNIYDNFDFNSDPNSRRANKENIRT